MALNTKKIIPFSKESYYAFQIFVKQSPSSPDRTVVNIGIGSVNNIIPSNILQGGNLQDFPLQKDSLQYVILKAQSNGKQINSAQIQVRNSPPVPQTPVAFGLPSSVEILIGGVYNSTIYQAVRTNITLAGSVQYIVTNTSNIALPYTVFMAWGSYYNS